MTFLFYYCNRFQIPVDFKLNPTAVYFSHRKSYWADLSSEAPNKLSSLNSHLFSKNIIDSPLCICGAIEDTRHYLFVCTRYLDLRQELINTVSAMCEPTLNVLLYGNTELSYEQNKEIFLSVQNYIVKSKRFQIQ